MPYSERAPINEVPSPLPNAPSTVFVGSKEVCPSRRTCVEAEVDLIGEGLLICTPTNGHGSSGFINKNQTHFETIRPVLLEEEIAPLSAPFLPSMTSTASTAFAETITSTASTTLGDNQVRVLEDSEVLHNPSHAPLPLPQNHTTVTRTCNSTDVFQLPQIESCDSYKSCKYVNRAYYSRDVYVNQLKAPGQVGDSPSWSRVVKQIAPSFCLDESWPSLLSSSTSKDTGRVEIPTPPSNAHRQFEDSLVYSANQFSASPMLLQSHQEVTLDKQCWPSLRQLHKENDSQQDCGINRKRTTLQPLDDRNIRKSQDQRGVAHGSQRGVAHGRPFKVQNVHLPPILLMVNKDFIVTSPLKENLLLTIALMGKRPTTDAPENTCLQHLEGTALKRQVLVGQFKAFSSFMHFMLGRDATRVRMECNAGGTSTISESLSVEYFVRRFQAKDIVTEMEVEYCSFNWKKVDFICTLYGQRVGVSVTRAMSFPDPKDFTSQMACRLLHKKLFGLVVARHGVSKRHSFSQCILHVWCETQQTASLMQREYDAVSRELDIADDVVMVLTVADGYHARPIFYEYLLRNESK